ncbi:MAG: PEP-CTERM sorting domain-containing protein [Rhodocyclaceae bacterium]|nr:PEP-CTERM sorting domain-containing protein [Rhodocyclaceae bacterium]
MKIKLLSALVAVALSGAAFARPIDNATAVLTADNEFWLFTGNAAGSNLQMIGHGADWGTAYTFNFNVTAGDYLYVMAYDWGQPHAWQGVFTAPVGTIYTNANSWVASTTSSVDVNPTVIASAQWGAVGTDLSYDSGPWGGRVGNANAHWIWNSDMYSSDTRVLFRTANPVAAVPEPETYAMFLAGLGVLGTLRRRRQFN